MNAIVSVTQDWGIGCDGDLLIPNKSDMKYFVEHTRGCTVIMGRKTLESFPGGPLKGRRNIIITRNGNYHADGVEVAPSAEAALELVKNEAPEKVWLIGGASIYRVLLDRCKYAYVTKHDTVITADTYFPNLDEDPTWTIYNVEDGGITPEGIPFKFVIYKHI